MVVDKVNDGAEAESDNEPFDVEDEEDEEEDAAAAEEEAEPTVVAEGMSLGVACAAVLACRR